MQWQIVEPFFATAKKIVENSGLDQQVQSILTSVVKWLELPPSYTPIVEWSLRISGALFIFFFFLIVARKSRIKTIVSQLDDKIGVIDLSAADRSMFSFLIWVALWLPGTLIILYMLKLTGLLATLGVSAGALATIVAMSNREFLGNIFAGFSIQARNQVRQGNTIEVMSIAGTLKNIGLTACQIEDFNGVMHFIPNAKMLNQVLTNYSMSTFRRVEIPFWIDVDEVNMDDLEALLDDVIEEITGKKEGMDAYYRYGTCSEKGQEIKLYIYMNPAGWGNNASEARRLLLDKLEEADMPLGIPQQLVLFVSEEEKVQASHK